MELGVRELFRIKEWKKEIENDNVDLLQVRVIQTYMFEVVQLNEAKGWSL